MTEELREGLYLAATGMGLVFLSLLAFMLILIALGKLFPGEEVEEVDAAVETLEAAVQEAAQEAQPAPVELAPAAPPEQAAPLPEQAAPAPAPPQGGVSGAKIAAMAVAMYLAMEQEEVAAAVPVVAPLILDLSRTPSEWGSQGRASLWQSQGRRPQAYGQRSYGAYSPGEGVR